MSSASEIQSLFDGEPTESISFMMCTIPDLAWRLHTEGFIDFEIECDEDFDPDVDDRGGYTDTCCITLTDKGRALL